MKLKFYLRGFGVGIIFTALVFSFIIIPNTSGVSDEEIIEKAKSLGMVEKEEPELNLDSIKLSATPVPDVQTPDTPEPEQTVTPVEQPDEGENTPSPSPSPSLSPTPVMTLTLIPTLTPTPVLQPVTQEPEPVIEATATPVPTEVLQTATAQIEIVKGMTSEQFCAKLQMSGIVGDANELNAYMVQNGYAYEIRIGSYELNSSMTYYEICETVAWH